MSALLEAVAELESKVGELVGRMEAVSLIIPDLRVQLNEIRADMTTLAGKVAALEGKPAPSPAPAPEPAPAPPPQRPIADLIDERFALSDYVLHAEARPGWLAHFTGRRTEGWTDAQLIAEIDEIIERDGRDGKLKKKEGPVLSGSGQLASGQPQ